VPRVDVVRQGSTNVRVHVTMQGGNQPFWLVLGQSQSPGWRAHIVKGKSLGGSKLVDGYANGWLITPTSSSFDVAMEWVPQRQVWAALWLSLAFMILCVVIVAVTWRRRLRTTAREGDQELELGWRGFTPPTTRARVIAVIASGVIAAIVVTPWVGLVVAAATIALTARARVRAVVLLVPAALLALCALYIVAEQYRYNYPSVFEWPTLFPHARTPAWIAVALLAADMVVEIVQRALTRRAARE